MSEGKFAKQDNQTVVVEIVDGGEFGTREKELPAQAHLGHDLGAVSFGKQNHDTPQTTLVEAIDVVHGLGFQVSWNEILETGVDK